MILQLLAGQKRGVSTDRQLWRRYTVREKVEDIFSAKSLPGRGIPLKDA
jgi:hypothetical protein